MSYRKEKPPDQRIVITGYGTVNPSGLDAESSWKNWRQGKSGITTEFIGYPPDQASELVGKIKGFDIKNYPGVNSVKRLSLSTQYAYAAGLQAFELSKTEGIDPDRIGVIIGSAMGGAPIAAEVRDKISRLHKLDNLRDYHTIPQVDANSPSAAVARLIKASAGAFSPAEACATGAFTGMLARNQILMGDAEIVYAGGTEASLTEVGFRGFHVWEALSPYIETPETASRPFDESAKGFVLGEAAGVLVYERLSHALARGAEIYAEFLGYGLVSATHEPIQPTAESEAKAIRKALIRSGLPAEAIDYINPHAAGTMGDTFELDAILLALGEQARKIPISSTKSMIGHTMGAAGAVELIASILTMHKGEIHPNPTLETPCKEGFYLPRQATKANVIVFLKNAFGLNGAYYSCIFGKYPDWQEKLAA